MSKKFDDNYVETHFNDEDADNESCHCDDEHCHCDDAHCHCDDEHCDDAHCHCDDEHCDDAHCHCDDEDRDEINVLRDGSEIDIDHCEHEECDCDGISFDKNLSTHGWNEGYTEYSEELKDYEDVDAPMYSDSVSKLKDGEDCCDLDPTKICDNCGRCLDYVNVDEKGYVRIPIDRVDKTDVSLNDLYEMYGIDNLDDDDDDDDKQ